MQLLQFKTCVLLQVNTKVIECMVVKLRVVCSYPENKLITKGDVETMSKDINKILAEIEYNKKLNSAKTEKVKSDYTAILENEKLKELKNKIRLTNSIRFGGFTLYALSFLGLIASTSLSLAGGLQIL